MDLVGWDKAQKAAEEITDHATREIATGLIPVAQAATEAIVNHAQDRFDAALGNAITAADAERTEIVNDLHALLDRLNGTELRLTEGGFRLTIPERKL
jgi:hypothetical protein